MAGKYVIEFGDLYFHDFPVAGGASGGKRRVCGPSEMMAIAYDSNEGTLYKHGTATGVEAWAVKTRAAYCDTGFEDFADAIVVISFPIAPATVAELNACLETTTRVAFIVENLGAIARDNPDIVQPPRIPD